MTVADDDDVILQTALKLAHTKILDQTLQDQLIRRPDEDEPDEQANRRHQDRIDQPRLLRNRHDVAVANSGNADHGEVHDVRERDRPIHLIAQPVAIEPEHRDHDKE